MVIKPFTFIDQVHNKLQHTVALMPLRCGSDLFSLLVGIWLWADIFWRPRNIPSFLSNKLGSQIRSANFSIIFCVQNLRQVPSNLSGFIPHCYIGAAMPNFMSKIHTAALRKKKDQYINQLQENMAWWDFCRAWKWHHSVHTFSWFVFYKVYLFLFAWGLSQAHLFRQHIYLHCLLVLSPEWNQ